MALRLAMLLCVFLGLAFAQPPTSIEGQTGIPTSISVASNCKGTSTVTATTDLAALKNCRTFLGSLVVSGVTVTSSSGAALPTVALPSLRTVKGSLEFTDLGMGDNDPDFAISVPLLERVEATADNQNSGTLSFTKIGHLDMPKFESLEQVQTLSFDNVEFIQPTAFQFQGSAFLKALTAIASLKFVNTAVTKIGPFPEGFDPSKVFNGQEAYITIEANPHLTSISLPGFAGVTTSAYILNNENCESVDFTGVTTGDAFYIQKNGALTRLTLDLQTVATLNIWENADLKNIDLSDLTAVTNQLEIKGPIDTLLMSPSLTAVAGSMDVATYGALKCKRIRQITQGNGSAASCSHTSRPPNLPAAGGASGSTTSPGSSESQSSTSQGSGGLSTGAKVGIGVGVGIVGALIIAGIVFFFCCRGRRRSPNTTREISTEGYTKAQQHSYNESGDLAYSKLPYHTDSAAQMREPHREEYTEEYNEEYTPTSMMGDTWSPPEQNLPLSHRVELEEQQGPRHEMDARSLPDMDSDEDDEAETRSLEDIERVHRQR